MYIGIIAQVSRRRPGEWRQLFLCRSKDISWKSEAGIRASYMKTTTSSELRNFSTLKADRALPTDNGGVQMS